MVGSYLRYGAYPYAIAVREYVDGEVIEHRFVGLFTVAAMNADVLEIPTISRRVREALAMADSDPIHPGQLLLDVIQTVPRSELFTLSAERLLAMAKAVVDLGPQRNALLFLRADRLQYFVSCLVYLPRDRYTTAVRLQIEDILVHEFGGTRLEFTARVSESPWALMHFMVRLPSDDPNAAPVDVSEANRIRIQALLSEAARTWTDRLVAAAAAEGSVGHADAEYYAAAFPEVYKQAVTPADAIDQIAIIKELQDNSVKLVFTEADDGTAQLTWFMGGRTASLSQLLPMLQSMGVVVLEERPFTVNRSDGLPVWIYQFKISPHPTIQLASTQAERDAMAERFADAVTAIWQGRLEIDRFNELVMRAGLRWQQVVLLRAYAKYLRQANFPYSQSYIESVLNEHSSTARSLVALFEALFDPSLDSAASRDAQAAAGAVAADIDALVSLDTDRIHACLRIAGSGHAADQLLCHRRGFGPRPQCVGDQAGRPAGRRAATATAQIRDLRLLAPGRGRAPAVRPGGPWRPALVGPSGRLPHRDPGPGQGASGQERSHRAGGRQGRIRPQAATAAHRRRGRPTATPAAPRASRAISCSSPACSTSPTTSTMRPERSARHRKSSGATATTRTWW